MQPHPWSVDEIDLTRPRTWMYVTLDVHITLLQLLRGWKHKTKKIPNPPKCDDTKSPQKINMAQTWPKNQKLNVEGHISSTLTRYERKPIPPNGSWQSTSYTGLLVDIIPLSNEVWDQVYPYRHVAVRIISLGERDYKPVLMWPRRVSPNRNPH